MKPLRLAFYSVCTAFCLASSDSHAAVSIVSPWHTAGNGSPTDYGLGWFQVTNLALYHESKDAFGPGPNTGLMTIAALGFSDLQGISYSATPVANVRVVPVSGWTGGVSFFGFELGSSGGVARNVAYQIWNGDFTVMMEKATVPVGVTHYKVNTSLFSPNGFNIQFESAGLIGIDNYAVEGGASAAPEPSAAMLAAASAGFLLLRRRRE